MIGWYYQPWRLRHPECLPSMLHKFNSFIPRVCAIFPDDEIDWVIYSKADLKKEKMLFFWIDQGVYQLSNYSVADETRINQFRAGINETNVDDEINSPWEALSRWLSLSLELVHRRRGLCNVSPVKKSSSLWLTIIFSCQCRYCCSLWSSVRQLARRWWIQHSPQQQVSDQGRSKKLSPYVSDLGLMCGKDYFLVWRRWRENCRPVAT